jgi:hypothetical protein
VDKKDKKLHMCIYYHALNKINIKNNYPLLWIDYPFDHLNGASYFSQIELKLNYYQIHVEEMNVGKTSMKTMYDFYEFLVLPFGLCNVSFNFTTLMSSIFHEKLDEFIIIYIDDILV